MASEFFGRQREFRFYTAGCGNKMVVSATGPRAANELGGPVIPGSTLRMTCSINVQFTVHNIWEDFLGGIGLFGYTVDLVIFARF